MGYRARYVLLYGTSNELEMKAPGGRKKLVGLNFMHFASPPISRSFPPLANFSLLFSPFLDFLLLLYAARYKLPMTLVRRRTIDDHFPVDHLLFLTFKRRCAAANGSQDDPGGRYVLDDS